MSPILLAFLIQINCSAKTLPAIDPPYISVSSLEPFELPFGVIVTLSHDKKSIIGITNMSSSKLEAAVFDSNGIRVSYLKLDESDQFDLKELPKGEYILRIVDQDRKMNMYRIRRNEQ